MAHVLLFHHAQGLTPGVLGFADRLRAAGHQVSTPDLYAGRTFATLEEGMANARGIGFENLVQEGCDIADGLPQDLVYAGFSLGVMPAQTLAQTRPGAKGALLFQACLPPAELGGPWPDGLPVQIHGMDGDPEFAGAGDLDAARELVASVPDAELYVYPGDGHLFADPGLDDYDPAAAALLERRVLEFLSRV